MNLVSELAPLQYHEAPPEMLRHVLDELPPVDTAMLSRVDRACRAAVRATGLSLVGCCRLNPFYFEEFTASVERCRWARANGCPWVPLGFTHILAKIDI